MSTEKKLMTEAAILYYEKKCTQQEVAQRMNLSRQTVSKLLSDAAAEGIVEIRIRHPESDCRELEAALCDRFDIHRAEVCSVSGRDESVRQLMTVKKAAEYLLPILAQGNRNIGISWGRTLQALIGELPRIHTGGNVVFPLFGATDSERSCFLSNELARGFADRIGAEIKYAWFPYHPDHPDDCALFKKTSYYKKIDALWGHIDVAIVGIGNTSVLRQFEHTFGYRENSAQAVGDVATHLFTVEGTLVPPYDHALCASPENLKRAGETVAIACSGKENDKVDAMIGALRTGLIDTLITDEHTARSVLAKASPV